MRCDDFLSRPLSCRTNSFAVVPAIAITDGRDAELMAVLAHEVSHIAGNDIWVILDMITRMTRMMALIGIAQPLAMFGGAATYRSSRFRADIRAGAAALLQLSLSRTRRRLCADR